MSDKQRKISITLFILTIVFTIIGSTLAYWSWQTSTNDQTNVTFRVTSDFSCGADGGGSITSQQKILAPTDCTNANYAFQRPIVVKPTITANGKTIYMDLYLQVNQIGEYLAQSPYFKYALTTEPDSCTNGLVSSGTFEGTSTNSKVYLLSDKTYSATTNDQYYLYVWLDKDETNNNTQNQPFDISLGGTCSDNRLPYNGTIYRYSRQDISIGQKVVLQPTQGWCFNSTEFGKYCVWETESECEDYVTEQNMENTTCEQGTIQPISYETNPANLNKTFYLKHKVVDDIVTESYVGFVVTPEMAGANSGMKAGTYYLRGLDTNEVDTNYHQNCKSQYLNSVTGNCDSPYYEANKTVLQNAFGTNSEYCTEYPSTDYPTEFGCIVSDLHVWLQSDGFVGVEDDDSANCAVMQYGFTACSE